MRILAVVGALVLASRPSLTAQTPVAASNLPTVAQQIAVAVLPLPDAMRAGATVLGYRAPDDLVTLRRGTNGMICLADDPAIPSFHVACYHDAMEPFMARGRALRLQGVKGGEVDSVRYQEAREGTLPLPKAPASLYSLSGPAGSWNPASNEVTGARPLYVVYIPYATEESTGIPATPAKGTPWLMFPGTPKAHIMFVIDM